MRKVAISATDAICCPQTGLIGDAAIHVAECGSKIPADRTVHCADFRQYFLVTGVIASNVLQKTVGLYGSALASERFVLRLLAVTTVP